MTIAPPRRPAAFRLDHVRLTDDPELAERPSDTPIVFRAAEDDAPMPVPPPRRRRPRLGWSNLLFAALGVLVSLGIGLAVDQLIRDLFERGGWLGWVGIGAAAAALVAVLAIAIREIAGLVRLKRITRLREDAATAAQRDDGKAARRVLRDLTDLYRERSETAKGRADLSAHASEIIDGRDLIGLAERELLSRLDSSAKSLVLTTAKRVTVVTAISPRAAVDVLFVLVSALRLIRQLGQLYGGRPGTLGFLRLSRLVIGHLAVTGGMAAGDSLVQQVLGHGLAARLSARLGEGVVNGILTARIGIAAIDVCRPLPFLAEKPPAMADFMAELARVNPATRKAGED